MITINSPHNPAIKELINLRKNRAKKKNDNFIIDGRREIEIALKAGWNIESLFFCSELADNSRESMDLSAALTEKITMVSSPVFHKICYKESPDGFLAVVKKKIMDLSHIRLGAKPLIVVLERIEKPGNLGAVLRTAYAAGVTAIILNDNQVDIYNPNVIRASEGQLFTQTIAITSAIETMEWLKAHKIKSFAAATTVDCKKYTETDLIGPSAIIFGSESEGLGPEWLRAADEKIKIPMRSGIDSLNVSVSAAIILFEVLRQRES